MAGGGVGERELDQTPTWAVALVCAIIVTISILLEKVLHGTAQWFKDRKKEPMLEALEKIKAELMILGFISLLLTFGQNYIIKVCIPEFIANEMLPCAKNHGGHHHPQNTTPEVKPHENGEPEHHRRLLWDQRRSLAAIATTKGCKPGHVPLISINGLHQLHIFIFFLAVFHVMYSALTMLLGRLRIRGWKVWEHEAAENDALNDAQRFRLTHETSFVKDHLSVWNKTKVMFYFACFFRQFFRAIRKADYLSMRQGFISVHLAPGSKFNFQKYIKRSLEDDFKVVVGISPLLWGSAVLFLLLNVDGWGTMLWLSVMPLVLTLAIGAKLQAIITEMAMEIKERHAVVQGIPLVQVSDRHFWFSWPRLILHLIHLTLFQNAFEIIYFLWTWYEFKWDSCFHSSKILVLVRMALGVAVQVLCSYVTLPLYALVTQMGSDMKKTIFDDQTSKALMNWHKKALNKKTDGKPEVRTLGGSPRDLPDHFNNNNNNNRAHTVASVDILSENPPQVDPGTRLQNRDLLTGP